MLKSFQDFDLLFDTVICRFTVTEWFPHQCLAVHFLDCIEDLRVDVLGQVYRSKGSGSELLLEHILVYLFVVGSKLIFGRFPLSLNDVGADH